MATPRASRAAACAIALLSLAACGSPAAPVTKPLPSTSEIPAPSASTPAIPARPRVGARVLHGGEIETGRFAHPPSVAVCNDGSVVALYDWGRKILVWTEADEPRDISVPDANAASVDATGERLAVVVDTPRDALKIIEWRRGPIASTGPLSSAQTVGWLGDAVLLAGVQPGNDPRRVDLSGKVTPVVELDYNSEFVASNADGTAYVMERSHALSFWLDFFHAGKVKRIEDAPRPYGAAVFATTAVIITRTQNTDPDWPPRRQAITFDLDTGEQNAVPDAQGPTAVAASPTGFVFGFEDGHVTLTNASFAIVETFPGKGSVLAVDASPDGSHIAALRDDRSITVSLTHHP